ncbi:MAG TPA: peptide deformylase [Vicinamibacterales bacterium]|jgi:peptide deformylase|nr:peptide deformylase [Vicinamibacterales bacterium]
MSILKVARMGHPVLRARAKALDRRDVRSAPVQQLIDDLVDTMHEYHGVGLAAPQVHESLRIFVAGVDPRAADDDEPAAERAATEPLVLVNPELTIVDPELVEDWEGCLSIPDIRGRVPRARGISVRALDRNGERIEFLARDFAARVLQHEYDHLDGVLFFDRMKAFESLTFLDEYARYWAEDR